MSYTYFGKKAWIKQPSRTIKNWPSGLSMVQETHIYPGKLNTGTPNQINTPFNEGDRLDDGYFVFPEPEISFNDSGFTSITVTGYRRNNSSGTKNRTLLLEGNYLLETETQNFVIERGEEINFALLPTLKAYYRNGVEVMPTGYEIVNGVLYAGRSVGVVLTRNEIVTYGQFSEVTLVYQAFVLNG
jgi:hypothetical protein